MGRNIDRRTMLGGALGVGAAAALSGCKGLSSSAAAEPLTVGGLAVTCNLTLPVACAANAVRHRRAVRPNSPIASTAAGPRSRNR
jgi:NitT/TauT family transport system substrate-binding protein